MSAPLDPLLKEHITEFYITGQGRVIHWECNWSLQTASCKASIAALNGLALAHLKKGCEKKRTGSSKAAADRLRKRYSRAIRNTDHTQREW